MSPILNQPVYNNTACSTLSPNILTANISGFTDKCYHTWLSFKSQMQINSTVLPLSDSNNNSTKHSYYIRVITIFNVTHYCATALLESTVLSDGFNRMLCCSEL